MDFIHDYGFHSSIMDHGSFFFQPITFKLEQFVHVSLRVVVVLCVYYMYLLLFKELVVEKSRGKLTLKKLLNRAIKPSPFKLVFACGINCWMPFWKPTRANVVDNRNLLWMQIGMRNWTCFGWGKPKNFYSVICTIASNHLLSIVNNTSSSLVVMESQRKPNF